MNKRAAVPEAKQFWLYPPVPVFLVSTIDSRGRPNVAPHSELLRPVTNKPLLVVGINPKHDTYKNILETKEFVVGVASEKLIEAICISGKPFPRGVSEFKLAGLTPVQAKRVKPPLVGECLANYECKLQKIFPLQPELHLVVGKVVHASARPGLLRKSKESTRESLPALYHVGAGHFRTARGRPRCSKIDYTQL